MSSEQRLINLGRLEEKKQRAWALALTIDRLQTDLAREFDTHRDSSQIDLASAGRMFTELSAAWEEFVAVREEIRALCEDLGVPVPNLDAKRRRG